MTTPVRVPEDGLVRTARDWAEGMGEDGWSAKDEVLHSLLCDLADRIEELEALVKRAEYFANHARGFDWNEDRCVMSAIHLAGDCRAALNNGGGRGE